jgi:DNA ligase-1
MELFPVDVFFFDIFYLEGKPLLKKFCPMKRTLLEKYVKESGVVNLARRIVTENLEEIEDFLMKPWEKDLKEL